MGLAQPDSPTAANRLSDAELAERSASGDQAAFRLVMRRNNRVLFRTARSILKDDAEAEDAVQEAYLLAYRGVGAFRREAKLSTWLVRIVANEALARLRKRRRRAEVITLDSEYQGAGQESPPEAAAGAAAARSRAESPDNGALRAEVRRLLEAKIDLLPDAFRTVFVLRALEEMSAEETAACLSIPPATVRTRFFRAKSLLRESLSRDIDVVMEETFPFAGMRCDRMIEAVARQIWGVEASLSQPEGQS